MTTGDVALVLVVVIAFCLISGRIRAWPITMPMVFVTFGVLVDGFDVLELEVNEEGVILLGEVSLAVILFSDAVRIDVRKLRREAGLPARLLGIGLPLSIVVGTAGIALVLTEFSFWEAALVAAILAPTDAALGQAVLENESVPQRVRRGLNVESGLNDGLALPVVLLFAGLAEEQVTSVNITELVFQELALAVVLGAAIGVAGGRLMQIAADRRWMEGIYAQIGTLGLALLAYVGAETAGANGFVSVFVAGLAFSRVADLAEKFVEYAEDTGRLLAMATFFVFGIIFVSDAADVLDWRVVLCVLMTLTVGRMLPVAIALTKSGSNWRTMAFIGWFGPRGLASILYGLLIVEQGLPAADELFAVITWTVVGSVFLHGATAAPLADRYGAWFHSQDDTADMPEAMPVPEQRVRWED